jgi:hypothetical protein
VSDLFLRLRKAVTKRRLEVHAVAPFASPGLAKLDATVLAHGPGRRGGRGYRFSGSAKRAQQAGRDPVRR